MRTQLVALALALVALAAAAAAAGAPEPLRRAHRAPTPIVALDMRAPVSPDGAITMILTENEARAFGIQVDPIPGAPVVMCGPSAIVDEEGYNAGRLEVISAPASGIMADGSRLYEITTRMVGYRTFESTHRFNVTCWRRDGGEPIAGVVRFRARVLSYLRPADPVEPSPSPSRPPLPIASGAAPRAPPHCRAAWILPALALGAWHALRRAT